MKTIIGDSDEMFTMRDRIEGFVHSVLDDDEDDDEYTHILCLNRIFGDLLYSLIRDPYVTAAMRLRLINLQQKVERECCDDMPGTGADIAVKLYRLLDGLDKSSDDWQNVTDGIYCRVKAAKRVLQVVYGEDLKRAEVFVEGNAWDASWFIVELETKE